MSIKVVLTEKEILDRSNDFELGEYARNKYWQERRNLEGPPIDDEHFILNVGEDGLVKSIERPWEEPKLDPNSFDKCVICGKETPYLVSTHIDHRVGYVEGCGQGCYQPQTCDRV